MQTLALAKREQRSNEKVLPPSDMEPQASLVKGVVVILEVCLDCSEGASIGARVKNA